MTVSRLTVHLLVLSLLFIGGCLVIPVGNKTIGKEIHDEDLAFIELGATKKSEVIERLGEPFIFFEKQNVSYYQYYTKTEFIWVGVGAGAAGAGDAGSYRQVYDVYILFDSEGHVKRFQRHQQGKDNKTLHLMEWLESE